MKRYALLPLIALTLLVQAAAEAQTPTPSTLTYKMTMGAGPGTGSMDYTMEVAITSTDPDGTRKATLTLHGAKQMMEVDNKPVSATITPFGALIVGSTGDMPKNVNPFNIAAAKQMEEAGRGPMVQMMINPINVFANGFSKAPSSLQTGTTWHAFSNEEMTDIQYTVTGREQRNGRDTVAVTIQNASGSAMSVSGKGNYDTASRLVVAAHCELRKSAQDKNGQIVDVSLANP